MPVRLSFGACLLGAVLAVSLPASAEPPRVRSTSITEAADAELITGHLRRADQARLTRRWYDAIAAYVEALTRAERAGYPPEKLAPILGELGACEAALGKHLDAAEHLHRGLKYTEALSREQEARFRQAQKKVEREVVMVFISVEPSDAEVLIDGHPIGARRTSHVAYVEPGRHKVRARLAGHTDDTLEFSNKKGTMVNMSLRLTPEPKPSIAAAPAPRAPLLVLVPPASDVPAWVPAAGFITAGVGVAAGIGFTVGGVVMNDRLDDRAIELRERLPGGNRACNGRRHDEECAALLSMMNTRDALDAAALGSFIVGALAGGVALYTYVSAPKESRPKPVQVLPAVSMNHAGALLTGSF